MCIRRPTREEETEEKIFVWRIFCEENYGRNVYIVIMWRPAHWSNIKGVFVFVFQSAGGHIIAVELFFPSSWRAPFVANTSYARCFNSMVYTIYNKKKTNYVFRSFPRFIFVSSFFLLLLLIKLYFLNVFMHSKKQRQTNMTEK